MTPITKMEEYAATLEEVAAADDKGCNRERMRQIQDTALAKLRKRAKRFGLTRAAARESGTSEPDVYLSRAQCVDCNEDLGRVIDDPSERRCGTCARYDAARRDGLAEGTYATRTFLDGALHILSRWPGTTT